MSTVKEAVKEATREAVEGTITSDIKTVRFGFLTLNLGHVLTILTLIGVAYASYYGIKGDVQIIDSRVGRIEASVAQFTAVLISTARQDEKLIMIEKRVDRLESK